MTAPHNELVPDRLICVIGRGRLKIRFGCSGSPRAALDTDLLLKHSVKWVFVMNRQIEKPKRVPATDVQQLSLQRLGMAEVIFGILRQIQFSNLDFYCNFLQRYRAQPAGHIWIAKQSRNLRGKQFWFINRK